MLASYLVSALFIGFYGASFAASLAMPAVVFVAAALLTLTQLRKLKADVAPQHHAA